MFKLQFTQFDIFLLDCSDNQKTSRPKSHIKCLPLLTTKLSLEKAILENR